MNDEKVLNYLIGMEGRINSRFEKLETQFDGMQKEITVMQKDITGIKKEQAGMKKEITGMKKEQVKTNQRLNKIEKDVAYAIERAERTSESVAVIEVEHGKKIGVLFDNLSLLQDTVNETNDIVKVLYERQANQELSIKWIDSRMKKAAM